MDSIRTWFSMTSGFDPPVQARTVPDASLAGFIARIEGSRTQVWRTASTAEALGVPAIFSAVTLISNAMGSMSMKAFQKGRELADDERPRIIIRPNPFSIPRDFFRDTAYSMAVYGEAWWWVAARDFDDLPLSLIPVNPREIKVTEDPKDLRFPIIEWRNRKMPNRDMRQITYLRDPGALRGFGPLQKCGAAVSVAVEAQEWAANYYADGGIPSIGVKMAIPLSGDKDLSDEEAESEADRLAAAWMRKPHNTPRFYGPDVDSIQEFGGNAEGSQMLGARAYNDINAAQLFNIPAPMIEAAVAGQNLTYQNIPDLYDSFARRCLAPNYAEPIEQTMSDLLTRQIVARHNFEALLRVDLKTRWEVYEIASKVIGAEEAAQIARQKEGIAPGDVEFAPVPAAVPQAIPAVLPIQTRTNGVMRCPKCHKARFVVESSDPLRLQCVSCKTVTEQPPVIQARVEAPQPLQMHLHLPERMAVVENHPPEIRVESPSVNITPPEIRVEAPVVTFAEGAFRGGDTHIATPDVRVEVHPPEITMPEVTVQASVIPAPEVHIEPTTVNVEPPSVTVNVPPRGAVKRTATAHDKDGRVTEVMEVPV